MNELSSRNLVVVPLALLGFKLLAVTVVAVATVLHPLLLDTNVACGFAPPRHILTTFASTAAEMVGAYLIVHIHILPRPSWPIENRGELAVLYFFVFVYMIAGAKVRAPAAAMALIERLK